MQNTETRSQPNLVVPIDDAISLKRLNKVLDDSKYYRDGFLGQTRREHAEPELVCYILEALIKNNGTVKYGDFLQTPYTASFPDYLDYYICLKEAWRKCQDFLQPDFGIGIGSGA